MTEQYRKRGVTSTDIWPIPSNPVQSKAIRPAEEVPARWLINYLCSEARPTTQTLYLDACRRCESSCAYGKRLYAIKERESANDDRT